ncbi:MAG: metallopeptidase family protein [Acidobacteria bacterium]|uniref:Metallopeptidase family protein n=1 Tax=Candidatus Sulfomarinibacter kjeldsenii TaxID=2885994 RepID=A0A8J6YC64_9BACT|nr:metallopeptidase family protein [Candidatus Sulfomarinibacter kjeldsenii]MBD3870961.1 metallopeptidase family protein [Candidatus Sulfomarinibacter kjeldsenii]
MVAMKRDEFEAAVAEALDGLPLEFAELISNVSIQVRETPDIETLRNLDLDPRHHTLFGLYTGVPLDERGGWYGNVLPDVIVLYRRPLLDACPTRAQLIHQIQLTLLHEIGHHFGLSDEEMGAWEQEFGGLEDDETITN